MLMPLMIIIIIRQWLTRNVDFQEPANVPRNPKNRVKNM